MTLPTSTLSWRCVSALQRLVFSRLSTWLLLLCVFTGSNTLAAAATPANGVILFDGPQGAAYVQITSLTLNGKAEVRTCEGIIKFDKNAYDALPKANFTGATSLQRGKDGALTLTVNGKAICAVPNGVKFDKKPELTPAEAAEQTLLQGAAVSSSLQDLSIPAFKPGVQLVFIAAPDVELAEYLRAQRAATVKDWQDFLSHHQNTARAADAKNAIAALHQQAGESAFAQYQKSVAARKADISLLLEASGEAQAAVLAVSGYGPAVKLNEAIGRELEILLEPDRTRLQSFQKALQEQHAGYSQLSAAKAHIDLLAQVRPDYAPVLNLKRAIAGEEQKLESVVATSEALSTATRHDEALTALGPYRVFAPEVPRIDAIVSAAYKYHFGNGQSAGARQEWEQSVTEYKKAAAIRTDSKEADAALKNASQQLAAKRDQQEANLAILQSQEYAGKSQYVEAYNTLADLPDSQRALVKSQLTALAPQYIPAAAKRAQKLQDVHLPIKGRADEDAVREAYVLLDRASSASGDPALTVRRDFLSNKISSYYVDQASRYLDRPSGSGAGIGWLYLSQAQRFGITNVASLKDQIARYAPLYQRRSHISIGIVLRDQTSRSENPDFADQLTDAIANGLDASGVTIEVVRKPSDANPLPPNFMLVAEILDHRVVKNTGLDTPQSKYRAGTHDVKSPEWLQANSDYEAAQQQVSIAQRALADAQSEHKRKDLIAAADQAVQDAQKRADDLRRKMASIEENRVEQVIETYHYTKKTVDLTASVELAVRFNDRTGNPVGTPISVHKDNRKTAVVVQDVKPDDTEGVTNQGVEPDQAQFLTDVEIEARNALIKQVRDKISELPERVLQDARARVQRGDVDGAAEQYVMFLNATPDNPSPEREEAAKFLRERFNLDAPVSSKL